MTDNRNEIVYRSGLRLDRQTAQLWDLLVARYPGLVLTQGVNSGAAASGNTHRGLGVVDFYLGRHANERTAVLKYAFEIGFFGWYRPELWRGKVRVWKSHIHLGVRGNDKMDPSLKAQQVSWTNRRNGLVGNAADTFTWRPTNFRKDAPYVTATKPKPPVTNAEAEPWFNASFTNTEGNSVAGGRTYKDRFPSIVKQSVSVSPSIVAFSEVRDSQKGLLRRLMAERGYRRIGYNKGNMLDVYARKNVTKVASSFAKFSRQRPHSNTEGAFRFRFRVDGSRAQVVVLHLDAYSSEGDREHNLVEAYEAAKRYGTQLTPDWKAKTLFLGDFNSRKVAAKVLDPRGFKQMDTGRGGEDSIDQAWVGDQRDDRGGRTDKVKADHKRKLVRLGRK